MAEIYVSTDVESDGPIPGPHSMLSLGSAAYRDGTTPIATFSVNLETLEGATEDGTTMEFWGKHPRAWEACRRDPTPPGEAMRAYVAWLAELPGTPVFVAYPAGFDFTFVHWYLMRFVGKNPFSFSALDMKTFAMTLLRTPYRGTLKRRMPERWFADLPHTHVALDDALEQGALFMNMLAEWRAGGDDA